MARGPSQGLQEVKLFDLHPTKTPANENLFSIDRGQRRGNYFLRCFVLINFFQGSLPLVCCPTHISRLLNSPNLLSRVFWLFFFFVFLQQMIKPPEEEG